MAAFVALTAAQLLRQPGARTWDTIWAEDGHIYATEALGPGWTSSIGRGYAGYVQVVPRLLALPLRALPAGWWSSWLAFAAVAVASLLALFVYRMSAGAVEARSLRAVVAVMTAVAPAMWFEANANIANLGWPLLIASFWALLASTTRSTDAFMRGSVLVGTALSTTVAVLYLPLAIVLGWRRRHDRGEVVLFGVFGVAVALQVLADQFIEQRPEATSDARHLPTLFSVRVLGSTLLGERWLDDFWVRYHGAFAVGLALAAAVLVVVGMRPLDRAQRALPAVAIGLATVFFLVPVWVRGTEGMRLDAAYVAAGSRYVVVPAALLVGAAAIVVQRLGRPWLNNLFVIHTIVVVLAAFGLANPRSDGPTWRSSVNATTADCAALPDDTVVTIIITPPIDPWYVATTCDRLGEDPPKQQTDSRRFAT